MSQHSVKLTAYITRPS